MREINTVIRKYDFVCGCLITPDISSLSGQVFTRLELSCQSPLEWAYYGATKTAVRKDACCHCGKVDATVDKELLKCYKTVLPICTSCLNAGKEPLKKTLIHTPAAKRALSELNLQNKKKSKK